MSKFWHWVFIIILIFSIYHLFRDITTDILGFHHPFVDIGHRLYPGLRWCGPYCLYSTFPLEIFNIIATIKVLSRNKVGILGNIILLTLPIWVYGWLSGEGSLLFN